MPKTAARHNEGYTEWPGLQGAVSQSALLEANDVNRVSVEVGDQANAELVFLVNKVRITVAAHRLAKHGRETLNQVRLPGFGQEDLKSLRILRKLPVCNTTIIDEAGGVPP
jgi:hypothetical protein